MVTDTAEPSIGCQSVTGSHTASTMRSAPPVCGGRRINRRRRRSSAGRRGQLHALLCSAGLRRAVVDGLARQQRLQVIVSSTEQQLKLSLARSSSHFQVRLPMRMLQKEIIRLSKSKFSGRLRAGGYLREKERNEEKEGGGRLAICPLGVRGELLLLLLLADGAAGH